MAFYDAPNPTNDPNYLHQSREPSRNPTIQDVAIPAKISSDASLGKLFEGVGDVLGLGLTATDNTIKQNIKDDAYKAIDPLRDAAGADMTPGEVQPIAGTGQRSRARVAALGTGANADGVVAPDDTPARPLPAPINIEVGRVARMAEAYKAGKLSDSYYDAQLVSVAKDLKSKYPGYRDEVDSAISNITGIVPANALRKSLLADLNANAAAQMASANSQAKWEEKNGALIVQDRPDYFTNKAKYAGQEAQIRSDVHAREGREAYIKAQTAEIGYDANLAVGVATQKAALIAGTGISQLSNVAGLNDPKTLQAKLAEFAKNGGGNPEELAQFNMNLEAIKAAKSAEIDDAFNAPLEGRKDGATLASLTRDPAKLAAIKEQALSQYTLLQTAIKNKSFDMAATIATQVTMQKNQAAKTIMDKIPTVKILAGIQQAGGDQAVGPILQGSTLLPQLQKSLADTKLIEVMGSTDPTKPPPGIAAQIDEIKAAGPVNGQTVKALVDGNMKMIQSKNLPEGVSAAAVRNLFDPKFFSRLPEAERKQVFTMLSSEDNTKRIAELSKSDPALWQQYRSWSLYAASSVYNKAAGDAQSYITDPHYTVTYNQDSHQLSIETKPEFRGVDAVSRNAEAAAQQALVPINQSLALLTPIIGKDSKDVNKEVLSFLSGVGVDPNAPKSSVGKVITDAVKKGWEGFKNMLPETSSGAQSDPLNPANRKRPDLSLNGAEEPALREVIGKAEAGGDYNAVFGLGKSTSRNLAENTVGEIMALQKHHTDAGSPSSAVGKYQFLRGTLASLVKDGKVSLDDQFTPDLQDQLAVALMKRRGLDDFRSGKITKQEFAQRLSKEWAGLPSNSGMSFYAGDGLNKSQVQLPTVLAALDGDAGQPPVPNAKRAPDGKWYVPDPQRKGKFLEVHGG